MTKQDLIDEFGSVKRVAEKAGVTLAAVSRWGEFPPHGRQCQFELLTHGKLKAEVNDRAA